MLLLTLAAFLFSFSGATPSPGPCKPDTLNPEVAKLVLPIVTELVAGFREEFDPDGRRVRESEHMRQSELLLYRLFKTKTRSADEALAVLVGLYLGEAPGEDRDCEIVHRGRRMLPYLKRYRSCLPVTGAETIPQRLIGEPDSYDRLIADISHGEKCEPD